MLLHVVTSSTVGRRIKIRSILLRRCISRNGRDTTKLNYLSNAPLARLHTLKNDLGLDDVITFLGKRSQESLPYYYGSADVVVMPSRYESFGMAALEAMACGTPVVASAVGGLSFVVRDGETGFLVPENDPQALANCLGKLLDDSYLRKRLGECGAQVARGYAWSHIAHQIEQAYQVVTDSPLAPISVFDPRWSEYPRETQATLA